MTKPIRIFFVWNESLTLIFGLFCLFNSVVVVSIQKCEWVFRTIQHHSLYYTLHATHYTQCGGSNEQNVRQLILLISTQIMCFRFSLFEAKDWGDKFIIPRELELMSIQTDRSIIWIMHDIVVFSLLLLTLCFLFLHLFIHVHI